jgi:hypothetical protein
MAGPVDEYELPLGRKVWFKALPARAVDEQAVP